MIHQKQNATKLISKYTTRLSFVQQIPSPPHKNRRERNCIATFRAYNIQMPKSNLPNREKVYSPCIAHER